MADLEGMELLRNTRVCEEERSPRTIAFHRRVAEPRWRRSVRCIGKDVVGREKGRVVDRRVHNLAERVARIVPRGITRRWIGSVHGLTRHIAINRKVQDMSGILEIEPGIHKLGDELKLLRILRVQDAWCEAVVEVDESCLS